MNQAVGNVWNSVLSIFSNIGSNRYANNAMKIQRDAVFVQESNISIQPQVMAGATVLLVVVLIVIARK